MHFTKYRCFMALLLSPFVFSVPMTAQTDWERPKQQQIGVSYTGILSSAGTRDYSRLRVQVWDSSARSTIAESHVAPAGGFELTGIPMGSYMLRVVNWQGDAIHTQSISVPQYNTITIKFGVGEDAPARIPISLNRLQHKVPKKAMKAFVAGHEAMRNKDRDLARLKFEEAVRIDPQYFEAANDLGVLYLGDERLSEAYEMFHRATVIDQGDPKAEANLAYVLLALHRFPEAEEAARSSLRADAMSSRGRYLLAVSLLEQKKSSKEVLFHLTQAKEHFEPARKLLQKLESMSFK